MSSPLSLLLLSMVVLASSSSVLDLKMSFSNTTRHALVFVPTSAQSSSPLPVVLNFHALASDPLAQMLMSDMNALAEKDNFVVVYPRGLEGAQIWTPFPAPGPTYSFNAGGCCPSACSKGADDVGFTKFLLSYLPSELDLTFDRSRIYATGMSNGGFMTNRVGCELSDTLAAIAPVSGPLMNSPSIAWKSDPFDCETTRPVPVLHIHGLKDIIVPFNGDRLLSFPKIEDSVEGWASRNGVPAEEKWAVSYQNGDVTCESVGKKATNVTLCKVGGGGHSWPGAPGKLCPESGPFACTRDLVASEAIWDFFKDKTL
jgi:polyhydroxybutyrate depolymerase